MDRRQFLKPQRLHWPPQVSASHHGAAPARRPARSEIGLLAPLTGVVASGGKEMVEGVQFYLDQVKGEIGGRKVELVIEDDASNPDTALQKARRLVEQGNVPLPDRQSARQHRPGGCQLRQGHRHALLHSDHRCRRPDPAPAYQERHPRRRLHRQRNSPIRSAIGRCKQGYKKIATIAQDYTFGHEQCGGFAQMFTEGGGEIVQQFWHPLNTADFSPYLGQLANLERRCGLRDGDRRGCDALHPAICELRPEGRRSRCSAR